MDVKLVTAFLESKNGWITIVLFVLYIAFKLGMQSLSGRKAKTREQVYIKASKIKTGIIESLERSLKTLRDQYAADLPREATIVLIQNLYYNFSNILISEITDLRDRNIAANKLVSVIRTSISILNDEKMQELELFLYRNRQLITFTSGEIANAETVIKIINNYANKNGMLAKELKNHIEIEMNKVIKRLY